MRSLDDLRDDIDRVDEVLVRLLNERARCVCEVGRLKKEQGIEVYQPEAFFLLASRRAGVTVEQIAKEFQLETLRDYLARSARQREEHLRGHGGTKPATPGP